MKQKKQTSLVSTSQEARELQKSFEQELATNPLYSLDVDPTGKYKFNKLTKDFIRQYIEFRNVNTVAEILHIEQSEANQMFTDYEIQSEIRRINHALYQHRFATKMINLDQLGGYLSSMLIDEFIPLAERLKPTEKLGVVNTLIKLNEMKITGMNNPQSIMTTDINAQLKDLSVSTIEKLIQSYEKSKADKEKDKYIDIINEQSTLTSEERTYLESLSTDEILTLLDETNKGGE